MLYLRPVENDRLGKKYSKKNILNAVLENNRPVKYKPFVQGQVQYKLSTRGTRLLLLFVQATNEQIITITEITINICFFIFYPHGNGVSLSSLLVVITLAVLNSSISHLGFKYSSFIAIPP